MMHTTLIIAVIVLANILSIAIAVAVVAACTPPDIGRGEIGP